MFGKPFRRGRRPDAPNFVKDRGYGTRRGRRSLRLECTGAERPYLRPFRQMLPRCRGTGRRRVERRKRPDEIKIKKIGGAGKSTPLSFKSNRGLFFSIFGSFIRLFTIPVFYPVYPVYPMYPTILVQGSPRQQMLIVHC